MLITDNLVESEFSTLWWYGILDIYGVMFWFNGVGHCKWPTLYQQTKGTGRGLKKYPEIFGI
jgi:hypothetical protein